MPSEPLKLSELENQLTLARHERPKEGRIEELAARVMAGMEKITAAKAAGNNGAKLQQAEGRLVELQEELALAARAEQRYYVLDMAVCIMGSFHEMAQVPAGARLALIVPDVIEVKVRLDGTDDVPF